MASTKQKYHLNFYIEKDIESRIRRKAEAYGVSISAMSNMLLIRGLDSRSD